MSVLFWVALFTLYYIYDGYLRILQLLAALRGRVSASQEEAPKSVTVLITVHNEAHQIEDKICNVIATGRTMDFLEVLVASDGSTDGTDDIVSRYPDPRVRLFRPEPRLGKTETQNQAVTQADGRIIVFTDADTRFDSCCLENVVAPFVNPKVGGVDGHVAFEAAESGHISRSQSVYWAYELSLRKLESRLGILAVASGGCLAVRKHLFKPMTATVGEDCIIPLDVVLQGYKMVHAESAKAYDRMPFEPEDEFRNRVRMTLRNWQGTWARATLLNPFVYPRYAFSLWSHKILRWLSPVFLILLTIAVLLEAASGSRAFIAAAIILGGFYGAGAFGWFSRKQGWQLPYVGHAYSFLLANWGFLVGLWFAFRGRRITIYRG